MICISTLVIYKKKKYNSICYFVLSFNYIGHITIMEKGVFQAKKKNGEIYYRASITRMNHHISLGSFFSETTAAAAYQKATAIYEDPSITLLNIFSLHAPLPIEKAITILNHRDNGIYIKTPIYLRKGYFSYFLKELGELKFDNDDLFYYSSHRILLHNGHLYVNDFGMQYGILARYGIKNYAVAGRDYRFANGDELDFRYQNIIIINRFHGVSQIDDQGKICYETKIHIRGDFLIGRFENDAYAAVAYNKAADIALLSGITKNFPKNYIEEYSSKEYAHIYRSITLPKRYLDYLTCLSKK